jgi:CO dehydrogenase maturation factor
MKISVCGKGGCGKSTVCTLLARHALKKGWQVLVVDADDSNTGLSRMLGFENPPTPLMSLVGGKARIKETMGHGSTLLSSSHIRIEDIPAEYMVEQNGLMLVGIGKILQALEGCACPMGVLCREFLTKLALDDHQIAMVDMEAGVEHFGRGIVEAIDTVLVVVEPSYDSMKMAEKIDELVAAMNKGIAVVLNKMSSGPIGLKMKKELAARGIKVIGDVPNDPLVAETSWEGSVLLSGIAFEAAGTILDGLLSGIADLSIRDRQI